MKELNCLNYNHNHFCSEIVTTHHLQKVIPTNQDMAVSRVDFNLMKCYEFDFDWSLLPSRLKEVSMLILNITLFQLSFNSFTVNVNKFDFTT